MDDIFKGLSLASVGLVLIGYVDLYSFYAIFDIKINDYVSASEILLAFTPRIFFVLISSIGFFVGYVYGFFVTPAYHIQRDQVQSISSVMKLFSSGIPIRTRIKNVAKALFSRYMLFLLGILFTTLLLLKAYFFDNSILQVNLETMVFITVQFGYFSSASFLVSKLNLVLQFFLSRSEAVSQLIVFVTFLIIFILISNSFKVKAILVGYPSFEVMLTGSVPIQTSDNLVFVGSTNEYIFFRYRDSSTNLIVRRSTVDQIEIKKISGRGQ